MRGIIAALAAPAAVIAMAGCGASTDSTPPESSATSSSTSTTRTASEPGSAQSWVMPDLIGSNLQEAQNAIQALTDNAVFYTGSTDLTGEGRNQVMDRNWQVCTSTPLPGTTFSQDTKIDFGVVRIDGESCPST